VRRRCFRRSIIRLGPPTAQSVSNGAVPKPAGEITAVRIGSRVVYRYRDADGHVVLVD
jgi:hypothetical protein